MPSASFDTLTAAREFEAAGLDRRQAEAIAKTVRNGQGELATKADLDSTAAALRADLVTLEVRLVKWAIGLALGVAGLTAAVVLAGVRLML